MFKISHSAYFKTPFHDRFSSAKTFNFSEINLEKTFRLIDSLLPLESCFHHQILPLVLTENCLTLGMVNQEDISALNYVRSILASLNCNYSLKLQLIDAKTHQLILSTYMNKTRTAKQKLPVQSTLGSELTATQSQQQTAQQKRPKNPHERPTLIVSNREELTAGEKSQHSLKHVRSLSGQTSSDSGKTQPFNYPLPLEVQARYLSAPVEFLYSLTPQQLWQELLGRAVTGGIGRLYFERSPNHGRIIWSQNGVWQLSLDKLTPQVFQSAIEELKHLANLPAIPLPKPKKFELERSYQQERLLLRLQVIPGKYGEEGTLQVLRGKALKFYQQRQMEELGKQALHLAKQLERKLRQIRARTRINSARIDVLPDLEQVQEKINRQLEFIAR